jgi:hypothetical protein
MGIEIKRNKKSQYKLTSTVSGDCYHPEHDWVDEDEAKRILIYNQFHRFVEKVIEIDINFPRGYFVNGKYQKHDEYNKPFNDWLMNALMSKDVDKIISDKFKEVYEKLKLEINIP